MPVLALMVQPGATPSSVMASLDIFRIADRFVSDAGRFQIDLLSAAGGAVALAEAIHVQTQPLPASLRGYDAVILPGFFAADLVSLVGQLQTNWQPVIERLRTAGERPLIGASCYGTFVLAESGLLNGRAATTTWWMRHAFAQRYPKVRLDADRALMADGRWLTAGAMTAHVDLSMQLLRDLAGAEVARGVASIMLVNEARPSQRPFMQPLRQFADPLAQRAADWMALHLSGTFSVCDLAAACHVSYRTLHRRFREAAGLPPLDYLQTLRVERAKTLLEEGHLALEGVVAEVGYADVSSFCRLFAQRVGLSPAQYRRQFRQASRG